MIKIVSNNIEYLSLAKGKRKGGGKSVFAF